MLGALYLLSLVSLALAILQVSRASRALGGPIVLPVLLTVALLLYLASLLPGMIGVLTPVSAGGTLIGLSLLAAWISRRTAARATLHAADPIGPDDASWTLPNLALGFVSVVALVPLLKYFAKLPRYLFSPVVSLPWDTVSYHLPSLVSIIQAGSLWKVEGPFRSYSFAYELIAGYPSLFFHSHVGIPLMNAFAILILLSAIALLVKRLVRQIEADGDRRIALFPVVALAIALWALQYMYEVYNFGKNDVFMTATILASFALLLEALAAIAPGADSVRQDFLLWLSAASLGLSIGTKPPALAYIPFLGLLALRVVARRENRSGVRALLRALPRVTLWVGIVVTIGGFFYVRNLFLYGSLSDPAIGDLWDRGILPNLTNPALYVLRRGSVLFLGAILLAPVLFVLGRNFGTKPAKNSAAYWTLGLHLFALGVFIITPVTVFHRSLTDAVWDIRLGMLLFTTGAIACALVAGVVATRLTFARLRYFPEWLALAGCAALAVLPWWWNRHPASGLPGYEEIKGLPGTGVYRWVQGLDHSTRIYASGLFPYGLYGNQWQNRVFYDLHSTLLDANPDGRRRLSTVLDQFHPELVIVAVDPHDYTGPARQPAIVQWMRDQPYFIQVYSDSTASAFRVGPGWQSILDVYPPLPSVEMGS